jgi:hypothetical protein
MPTLLVEESLNRTRRRRRRRTSKNGGSTCTITRYGSKAHPRYLKKCGGKRPVWISKEAYARSGKRAVPRRRRKSKR